MAQPIFTKLLFTKLFLKFFADVAKLSQPIFQSWREKSLAQNWQAKPVKISLGVTALGIIAIAGYGALPDNLDWFWLYVLPLLGGGAWAWAEVKREPQPSVPTTSPKSRRSLEQKLQGLQQQITQINDPSQRQHLETLIAQLNSQLTKNQFQIVLCGKGSTGKTAVLNALLGKTAAASGVTLGTTQTPSQYSYPLVEQILEHLDTLAGGVTIPHKRQISLVDTPALPIPTTEADLGFSLKLPQEFRQKNLQNKLQHTVWPIVATADLLLFVIDSDLTATEYQALKYLAQQGKRIILVLNKIDCYLPADRQAIIAKLTEITAAWVHHEDIVSVMAAPAPIKVKQYAAADQTQVLKEWFEPMPPEVTALKNRIETILSRDWEDLWCDNLDQQISELQTHCQTILHQQYRLIAEKIIIRYQWLTAGALFANPIPAIDLIAGTAIQTKMLSELGQIYGQPLAPSQAKELAAILGQSLVQGGCVQFATNAITACLKTNAATYAIGGTVQGMVGAYVCRVAAWSFIAYLEQTALETPLETTAAQPKSQTTTSQIKNLQNLCQQTFQGLQGERFFQEFVANCWTYRQTMPVNLS
ncbi:MAG: DUF697 domain-containing protein [Pseudanabaena sp. ELA607]